MGTNNRYLYVSPEIVEIDIEPDNIICTSEFDGQIESITEEDW